MQNLLKSRIFFSLIVIMLFFGAVGAVFCQTKIGDVNGNGLIDINDALIVARQSVGIANAVFIAENADADANGIINIVDALVIAQYVVGIYTTLPPNATPTPIPTPTVTPTSYPPPTHLDNAFENAKWYVNSEWANNARASGGAAIANCNTAVWLDRIASINASAYGFGMGLADHLNACLDQGANLIIIVLFDLPDRECSASATNDEIQCTLGSTGMDRYKAEFVDPIVNILKDQKYYGLRIVTIIEPNALANMVTNVEKFARCQEVYNRNCYVGGIQYVLNELAPLPNVYKYLDIAHSAWLGWPENFNKAISLYQSVVKNTIAGAASIDGFISNATYTIPTEEIFIPGGDKTIGGVPIKYSRFYDYNAMVDELDLCNAWYNAMSATFPGIGMLIDTSRNGWGGPNRPTKASTSTDVNVYVDESRLDRSFHRGNWCNNKLAGIGARPTAAPAPNIDAFVWIAAPGESDGVSQDGIIDPQDPNKRFDNMCDPNGLNTYCNCGTTDARANMPHKGRWSTDFFQQLLANAYPPIN